MKKLLVFTFLFTLVLSDSFAQNRNATVYFNETFGVDFLNKQLLGPNNKAYSAHISSVCDEKNGNLLFYVDNEGVYNPDHSLLTNGRFDTGTYYCSPIIVPNPSLEQSYYVFYVLNANLYYAIVDAKNTTVISKGNLIHTGMSNEIQCMSYIHKQGWWLVTHTQSGDEYYAFLILKSGIVKTPVVSKIGREEGPYNNNFASSSHNGEKLLVWGTSRWGANINAERFVNVLDFDKRCGTFNSSQIIYKDSASITYSTLACAFSPDDSKIFLNVDSRIIQYSGNKYADSATCFQHAVGVSGNVMFSAQDGYIYFMNDNRRDAYEIYRISNPDQKYPRCNFLLWKTAKITTTNQIGVFSPRQIMDNSYLRLPDRIDFDYDNACTGYKVQFWLTRDAIYDSVVWYFEDSVNMNVRSSARTPVHSYSQGIDYKVRLIGYICGIGDTVIKTIAVREKVPVDLGHDTVVCYRDKIELLSKATSGTYLWSDSTTGPSLWAEKGGKYWLRVKIGDCSVADTIKVTQLPDIWTALKDEYFICNDVQELAKLDAGGDFAKYKWSPTGDTSQWIIVGDVGSYFVVVKDFMGCKGADGTKVQRRCPVSVFYPNAFTPNNDGINDTYLPAGTDVLEFSLTIYNAWGQKIFTSNHLTEGWDGLVNGVPAPTGTYMYKSAYSGFQNKKMVKFEKEGNITLLR